MKKIIILPVILALAACSSNPLKTSETSLRTPFISGIATTPKIKQQLISLKEPRLRPHSILTVNNALQSNEVNQIETDLEETASQETESWLPQVAKYLKRGMASWYGPGFQGKKTATGEIFNMYEMTAAHKTLPIPSYAQVTNLKNNKSVIVRINDRGPYSSNRLLDLSYAAAKEIGIHSQGTGKVEVKALSPQQALPHIQKSAKNNHKKVYLQVGSFGNHHTARQLQDKIASSNLPEPSIYTSGHNKNTFYKVKLGPIAASENIEKLTYQLAKLGIKDPQIVTETSQN